MNRYSVCPDEFAEAHADWQAMQERLIRIERDESSAVWALEHLMEENEIHRVIRICNEFLERVK